MSKVSIIVPVYNVSQYLDKCIKSIVEQTLEDIEIILVNDVSPDDKDHDICQKWQQKDSRIAYIQHEHNLGIGGARNTGIRHATSKYIGFVDSDDWIAPTMYETLYKKIKETLSDIVSCGFNLIKGDEISPYNEPFDSDNPVRNISTENIFTCIVFPATWNKLWKKSLFVENNVYFPTHVYYEDLATTPRILYFSKRIGFVNDCLYYYYQREGSITNSMSEKHFDDYAQVFKILEDFLREYNEFDIIEKQFKDRIKKELGIYATHVKKANISKEEKKYYLTYAIKKFLSMPSLYWSVLEKDSLELIFQPERLQHILEKQTHLNECNKKNQAYIANLTQQNNMLIKELSAITHNRWYKFGQMSNKRKIWTIAKHMVKKIIK